MVRIKSVSSKVKTRKEAYKRREDVHLRISRSWRILILTIKAAKRFLRFRNNFGDVSYVQTALGTLNLDLITSSYVNFCNNKETQLKISDSIETKGQFDDSLIIQDIIKRLVSKVCRLDHERMRQLQIRKHRKKLTGTQNKKHSGSNRSRQNDWFMKKYYHDVLFRQQQLERITNNLHNKYKNDNDFYEKHKARTKSHILVKYHIDRNFREKQKTRMKSAILGKYHTNKNFREAIKSESKVHCFDKYHNDTKFRDKVKTQSKIHILNKYHNNLHFRDQFKACSKNLVSMKYNSNPMVRLKTIERALSWYRNNNTMKRKNLRRIYNQSRRIFRKYIVMDSHKCTVKHRNSYMDKLNRFRQIVREGPDYICISCRLALFRDQVIPFIEEKYIKQNMSYEMKERIQSYFNYSRSTEQQWICKFCSDKIKKRQMPSRAILNKLKVCEIPSELKKLNNLEKHLIALRLPFMKILNLTSGKVSSRLAQKGTKGPLHCVPSNVQDTVITLPRPVDKSMMVRLQLKRRLKYKAVWEE